MTEFSSPAATRFVPSSWHRSRSARGARLLPAQRGRRRLPGCRDQIHLQDKLAIVGRFERPMGVPVHRIGDPRRLPIGPRRRTIQVRRDARDGRVRQRIKTGDRGIQGREPGVIEIGV